MSEAKDTNQRILDEITYQAFTQPWPGRNGPRNSKVLAGILRECSHRGTQTLAIGLMHFGPDIGIAKYDAIKGALEDLAAEGWIQFDLGRQDDWTTGEPGKPSHITLLPRLAPSGSFRPEALPLPSLDIFRSGELGSASYLTLAMVMVQWQLGESYDPAPMGISDLVRLTGMTKVRVIRLMGKMIEAYPVIKKDGKYRFHRLDELTNRHTYSDEKAVPHRERLAAHEKARVAYFAPPQEQEQEQEPTEAVETIIEPTPVDPVDEAARAKVLAMLEELTMRSRSYGTRPVSKPPPREPNKPQQDYTFVHPYKRNCRCGEKPGHAIHNTYKAGDYERLVERIQNKQMAAA